MRKPRWRLYIVEAGEKANYEEDRTADNLNEAEKIARELFDRYYTGDYPDFSVWCISYDPYSDEPFCCCDFPVWVRDSDGTQHWNRMRMGDYYPICSVYDREYIEEIEEYEEAHKPKHMSELSLNQFEVLARTIGWGSMYLSDYANDFDVDEKEVSDYAEGYSGSLYEEYGDDWYDHIDAEDWLEYCAV